MLRTLIQKELRLARRSRRVWLSAAGMGVLSLVAAVTGGLEQRARCRAHAAISAYADTSFRAQKAAHPHAIAHNGYVVSRPPPPLGSLDAGIETAYGSWLRLDAHRTRTLQGARTSELARGPGAGRFDLGLVLAVFVPALVFILGYDQLAGERARGTLDMLRVSGIRAGPLIASKLIGLSTRVLAAIVAPLSVAVALAGRIGGGLSAARLIAWIVAHLVALAVWMLIVLLVSAMAPTPERALILGLGLWAALALVIPPLAGGLAEVMKPLPPPGEAIVRVETWAASAHAQDEALRERAIRDIRRRHPDWNGAGEPPEVIDAVMLRLADAEIAVKVTRLLDDLDREGDDQERVATIASMLSPSGLASLISSALAGSDLSHMRTMWRHYEDYRVSLMSWFNEWWAKYGRGGFDSFEKERDFSSFEQAPRLEQPILGLGFAARRALLPFVLLIGVGIFGMVALMVLVRAGLASGAGHS